MIFAPEVTPVRIAGLLHTLRATGPVLLTRLEYLLAPPSARDHIKPGPVVGQLVQFAVAFGLAQRPAADTVQLHPRLEAAAGSAAELLRAAAPILLGRGETGTIDEAELLARFAAWILDQAPTKVPAGLDELLPRWESISGSGAAPLTAELLESLWLWCKSLGVCRLLNLARKEEVTVVAVDPTPLLRGQLPEWMPADEPLAAGDWVAKLAEQLPVFDGGRVRERYRKSADQILSASLSLAIRQLAEDEFLRLEDRKDAPRFRLRLGRLEESFSHIARLGRSEP